MKRALATIRAWPITVKIPLLVAVLMVVVSAVISERVLSRLGDTQSRHLQELGNAYLDGLSSSLMPAVLRNDVWEVYDTIDRARGRYRGLEPVDTIVTDPEGGVLAASDPRRFPTGSSLSEGYLGEFPASGELRADDGQKRAFLQRDLVYQDRRIGTAYATFNTQSLLAERREVFLTLLATNTVITFALALLGYLAISRMVRPLRILSEHLHQGAAGNVQPITDTQTAAGSETQHLFKAYNEMASAMREREALAHRLAEEKRLASLGRLASGMAHEINNPLGGLFNSLDTLKRHGDTPSVRNTSIDLLERGLVGIRDVVRAALVNYRTGGEARPLQPVDMEDLQVLIKPELTHRSLALTWSSDIDSELPVNAGAVRQILLNLLLNACAASPPGSVVALATRTSENALTLTIDDSGPGLPQEARRFLTSEDERQDTPPEAGARLGLWLVRRLGREIQAEFSVTESELGGTRISLKIPYSDREEQRHVA
ncbi:MAG: ATP-binding protein [Pseudomonadota bacterium]